MLPFQSSIHPWLASVVVVYFTKNFLVSFHLVCLNAGESTYGLMCVLYLVVRNLWSKCTKNSNKNLTWWLKSCVFVFVFLKFSSLVSFFLFCFDYFFPLSVLWIVSWVFVSVRLNLCIEHEYSHCFVVLEKS